MGPMRRAKSASEGMVWTMLSTANTGAADPAGDRPSARSPRREEGERQPRPGELEMAQHLRRDRPAGAPHIRAPARGGRGCRWQAARRFRPAWRAAARPCRAARRPLGAVGEQQQPRREHNPEAGAERHAGERPGGDGLFPRRLPRQRQRRQHQRAGAQAEQGRLGGEGGAQRQRGDPASSASTARLGPIPAACHSGSGVPDSSRLGATTTKPHASSATSATAASSKGRARSPPPGATGAPARGRRGVSPEQPLRLQIGFGDGTGVAPFELHLRVQLLQRRQVVGRQRPARAWRRSPDGRRARLCGSPAPADTPAAPAWSAITLRSSAAMAPSVP